MKKYRCICAVLALLTLLCVGASATNTETYISSRPYDWYKSQLNTGVDADYNCAVACLSMAVKWYDDTDISVQDVRSEVGCAGAGINHLTIEKFFASHNVPYKSYSKCKTNWKDIKAELQKCNIIIATLYSMPPWGYHAVVIAGYKIVNNTEYLLIYDPMDIASDTDHFSTITFDDYSLMATPYMTVVLHEPEELLFDNIDYSRSSCMRLVYDNQIVGATPIIDGGTAWLPLRATLEAIGYSVQWQAEGSSILCDNGMVSISLCVGSSQATINGATQDIFYSVKIINGTAYVSEHIFTKFLYFNLVKIPESNLMLLSGQNIVEYRADQSGIDCKWINGYYMPGEKPSK